MNLLVNYGFKMYFLKRHETEFSLRCYQLISQSRNSLPLIQILQSLIEPRISYNIKSCCHEELSIYLNSSPYAYHVKNKNYKHNLLQTVYYLISQHVMPCNIHTKLHLGLYLFEHPYPCLQHNYFHSKLLHLLSSCQASNACSNHNDLTMLLCRKTLQKNRKEKYYMKDTTKVIMTTSYIETKQQG